MLVCQDGQGHQVEVTHDGGEKTEEEMRKEKMLAEEAETTLWYLNNMETCAESDLVVDKLFLWFNDSAGATYGGAIIAYVRQHRRKCHHHRQRRLANVVAPPATIDCGIHMQSLL